MALSVPERIAQIAEHIGSHDVHGYSQPHRKGHGIETVRFSDGTTCLIHLGDYDCSEIVRTCVCAALGYEAIEYMWTGNEDVALRALGFVRLPFSASDARRGDVLWVSGHTGVALGGGLQADAHGDEYGGLTGPSEGDQTGHEIEVRRLRSSWTYIYRWPKQETEGVEMSFSKTFKQEVNVRTKPSTSATIVAKMHQGERWTFDGIAFGDGYVWGTYVGPTTGRRLYAALGTHEYVR